MTEEEYKRKRKRINYIFFCAAILALILWGLSGYLIDLFSNSEEARGTFGDMFGMINALFSGLALGGVIYTILLQRLELELQRDEIRYSSEQLKGQKEILDRQNFEDKFFKLFELYLSTLNSVNAIIIRYGKEERYTGKQAIQQIIQRISRDYFTNNQKQDNDSKEAYYDFKKSYLRLIKVYNIAPLINIISAILDFTANSFSSEKGKNLFETRNFLQKIFVNQLSNFELLLIIHEALASNSTKALKVISSFQIFSNLDFELHRESDSKKDIIGTSYIVTQSKFVSEIYDIQKSKNFKNL